MNIKSTSQRPPRRAGPFGTTHSTTPETNEVTTPTEAGRPFWASRKPSGKSPVRVTTPTEAGRPFWADTLADFEKWARVTTPTEAGRPFWVKSGCHRRPDSHNAHRGGQALLGDIDAIIGEMNVTTPTEAGRPFWVSLSSTIQRGRRHNAHRGGQALLGEENSPLPKEKVTTPTEAGRPFWGWGKLVAENERVTSPFSGMSFRKGQIARDFEEKIWRCRFLWWRWYSEGDHEQPGRVVKRSMRRRRSAR